MKMSKKRRKVLCKTFRDGQLQGKKLQHKTHKFPYTVVLGGHLEKVTA